MRIGIGLPNPIPGTPGRLLVEWAESAEKRGFSSLATIDRIVYPSYESLITLAAAAAVTSKIGLVTNILVAPTRNDVLLAKEAASVDQISMGRLTLGLAPGGREDDLSAVGASFSGRGKRFDKQLKTLKRAWEGQAVAGSGQSVTPLVRDGGVPLLIGGMNKKAIARVVEYGSGWTAGGAPLEQIVSFAKQVKAAFSDAGRGDNCRIVALGYFSMAETSEQPSRDYLSDYYAFTGMGPQIAEGIPRGATAVKEALKPLEDSGVIDEFIFDPTVADLDELNLLADALGLDGAT